MLTLNSLTILASAFNTPVAKTISLGTVSKAFYMPTNLSTILFWLSNI